MTTDRDDREFECPGCGIDCADMAVQHKPGCPRNLPFARPASPHMEREAIARIIDQKSFNRGPSWAHRRDMAFKKSDAILSLLEQPAPATVDWEAAARSAKAASDKVARDARIDPATAQIPMGAAPAAGEGTMREANFGFEMQSTKAMRARLVELSNTERDDYDRAVVCVVRDLETILAALSTPPSQEGGK